MNNRRRFLALAGSATALGASAAVAKIVEDKIGSQEPKRVPLPKGVTVDYVRKISIQNLENWWIPMLESALDKDQQFHETHRRLLSDPTMLQLLHDDLKGHLIALQRST